MDQISVDEKQNNISFGSDDDVFIDVTHNRVQIGFNNYDNQRVHEILSMREIIETNRLLSDVIEHWAQNNLDYDAYLDDKKAWPGCSLNCPKTPHSHSGTGEI